MQNLLLETETILHNNGKTSQDVKWVGTKDLKTTWENFKAFANVEYDDGYGSSQVAQDLMIVGDSWYLDRKEYDGSEWWEFNQVPKEPAEIIELKAVTIEQAENLGFDVSCGWESLKEINGLAGENNE